MFPNIRISLYAAGVSSVGLSTLLLLFTLIALFILKDTSGISFLYSAIISFFIGTTLYLFSNKKYIKAEKLSTLLSITIVTWITLISLTALPFYLNKSANFLLADSIFEAASGLTSTGATVITNIDKLPESLKVWRCFLQWVGGIGVILLATLFLPLASSSGMQLFHSESSDNYKKTTHTYKGMSKNILTLYLFMSLFCFIGYIASGMSFRNSVLYTMTTVSTGGNSPTSAFAEFNNTLSLLNATIFMTLSGLPTSLLFVLFFKKDFSIFKDQQVKVFIGIIAFSVIILITFLTTTNKLTFSDAIIQAPFTIISILTGTGYVIVNYDNWGLFPLILLLIMCFVGGCTGSASGGIKVFRIIYQIKTVIYFIKKSFTPEKIFLIRYNNQTIPENKAFSTMQYTFIVIAIFVLCAIALNISGYDILTSFSAPIAVMMNVGPGFGDVIGATGSFNSFSPYYKILFSLLMLLGRLEFTIIMLFLVPYLTNQKN